MQFWQGFAIVTVVHLLAAASPGPDFALVTRQSLQSGRKAGILASLGIAMGLAIHIIYSAAGLAAVIAHSSEWMTIIKLAGGSFLVLLGIKGLRSGPGSSWQPDGTPRPLTTSPRRIVATGFLCNALNPKAPIYFLSLFTVVLSPDLPLMTLTIYGAWIMLLQMFWFTLVAVFFTHAPIRDRIRKAGHWIDRVFGAAMLYLGIRVLASEL